ncbi:hypothetical protein [Dyadobacter frigoris]|nr:hypothetical protein [Dyadobacter frigoris]
MGHRPVAPGIPLWLRNPTILDMRNSWIPPFRMCVIRGIPEFDKFITWSH